MAKYYITCNAYESFEIEAESEEDARNVAEELIPVFEDGTMEIELQQED